MDTSFHVMSKPTGPICNLDCSYCFYLEKEGLYTAHERWAMSEPVLESYIGQYIEAQPGDTVNFAWQGGEPTLLGVEFFRKAFELQQKYANGKRIQNALQTNGILLDDAWCEFLAEQRVLVGVSIDGPRALHDAYRVDKGGNGTFARVLRGIECLKKHDVEFNTLTTVHRGNEGHPMEVYRFLKEIGSRYLQFIPIVERKAAQPAVDGLVLIQPTFEGVAEVTAWSVNAQQYGRFLCAIYDEWVSRDVGRVFVQHFDVALESWLGMYASICIFRETCGAALALEHNGDLYSCDHFVYPEHKLGNVLEQSMEEMAGSAQQRQFGEHKAASLPKMCRECPVRFACHGECPKHRFLRTPDGEYGLNYLCDGYKLFFHHIDETMRFMAAELKGGRPPANVMCYVAAKQRAADGKSHAGRNDLCECGSGRKRKHCCGA
jgi:uncharacterized protein